MCRISLISILIPGSTKIQPGFHSPSSRAYHEVRKRFICPENMSSSSSYNDFLFFFLRRSKSDPSSLSLLRMLPATQASEVSTMASSSSTSFWDLLRKTEVPTDFVLEAANGDRFPCHSWLLLVRSRPMAAMMTWKEGEEGKLQMDENEETVRVCNET